MEKERKIKTLSVVALIVAVLGLTVAFAALSTQLTINGTASIETTTWDIHFENLSEGQASNSVGAVTAVINQPLAINPDDSTSLTGLQATLKTPGDTITYTFDVVNAGGIDAKVGSITKGNLVCTGQNSDAAIAESDASIVCNNLTVSLTYADGSEISPSTSDSSGDLLKKDPGSNRKGMKLVIQYNPEATTAEMPKDDVTIEFRKSGESNVPADNIIYSINYVQN